MGFNSLFKGLRDLQLEDWKGVISHVNKCTYLGVRVTEDGNYEPEINVRIHHHHHHHHHHVQEGLGLIPVPCILKMKLVPPSLPRSSYVSSSFWFIL
jgi:hypothetical protein